RGAPGDHRRDREGEGRIDPVALVALLVVLAVAGRLFARRALLLYRLVRMAKPSDRSGEVPARLRNEAVIALGQRKLLQRLVPGVMHAVIFCGFILLLLSLLLVIILS